MSLSTCSERTQTAAPMLPAVFAALKWHEALLAEIERVSSTGGFYWQTGTGEMTWTDELYRILEIDPAVPANIQRLGTRILSDDLPLFHDMIDRALRNASGLGYQFRLRLPDQTLKYLHVCARRSEGSDGQSQYIGAIQDITRRCLSEEALGSVRCELARLARVSSLGALAASIAHEVSQPLTGIITNASTCLEMLGDEPPDLDGARETARRTIRDGERACEVIARLRALFCKRGGKAESVDLNDAAREVVALSSNELHRNRVVLRTEFAEHLPAVTGDRVQLQQVILNLLLNAGEAMVEIEDRPRQLLVRTELEAPDRVCLSVQDTGVGIDLHYVERLFEAFYTTKSGGMGIGLWVSRSIIESHRGRLWAEPNARSGATFAFSLATHGSESSTQNPRAACATADIERLVRTAS
jgi:C4-dicarboxylate-specific signal transduction histidine kinase